MTLKRNWLTWWIVSLFILSTLACSVSGGANVEGKNKTVQVTVDVGKDQETTPTATSWPVTYTPTAQTNQPEPAATPTSLPEQAAPTATPAAAQPTATFKPAEPPPPPPAQGENPLETVPIPELKVKTLDPHSGGMTNLTTFRQKMTAQFKATDSSVYANYDYDADVNLPDMAMHITLKVEGTGTWTLPANTVQAIWIGTQLWFKIGNQPWLPVPEAVAEMQFAEQMFGVGGFMPYVPQVQRQDEATVNGIACAHYTYSSDSLPVQYGTMSGSGDIWVALDGGYVVRYTLNGSGTFTQYYQGAGTINLVYDTYDVGASIQISPPRR